MAEKDYLAHLTAEPTDRVDHGVIGMKWGQRRSSAALRSAASSRKAAAPSGEKKAATPDHLAKSTIQDHVESSSSRYSRLAGEAKLGRASQMTEQDLKFFNARTEALAKINKLNESEPSWLSKTSKNVLQTVAQQQMNAVATGIANKYISGPILDSLKKEAEAASASKPVAAAIKSTVSEIKKSPPAASGNSLGFKEIMKAMTTPLSPGMTKEQSLQFFRENPPPAPKPKGFSPSGNFDLFKQLKDEGFLDK
jgi:hypothetical protein